VATVVGPGGRDVEVGMRAVTGNRRAAATAAVLALAAGACSGGGGGTSSPDTQVRRLPDLTLAAALTPFGSCDALAEWIKAEAGARVGPYGLGGGPYWYGFGVEEDAGGDDLARGPAPPTTTGNGAYSTTNVPVEGVDEPDVVKTDGRRILALARGRLHLVDATAQPPRVLDTHALYDDGDDAYDFGYGAQLLLAGDRALVIGPGGYRGPVPLAATVRGGDVAPAFDGSRIVEVDLTGDEMRVVDEVTLEGSYVSARMVGDVARLVLRADPYRRLGFVQPAGPTAAAEAEAEAVNRRVVAESTVDDWLPHWTRDDDTEGLLVDCADVHRPQSFSGFGALTVLTVDLSEGLAAGLDARNGSAVLAGAETVYASAEHLYVATAQYVDWESLTPSEQRTVDRDYGTDVHRFGIDDEDAARYEMSGHVDGRLLNQFALDEHEGVLRVATTKGAPWADGAQQSESQVVTLVERDGALVEAGRVGGLGRGEQIYSVRFLGDRAYVVTFRQVDPLYTVDLADPAAPRVTGELKILGYSAYLHPVGDGLLLGVGQDATEDGRTRGTQLALFDVRDPAAPARLAVATIAASSSEAEWDHHAFLWWPASGLAVLPVQQYDSGFAGAVGFGVDLAGATIAERGRVEHPFVSESGRVLGDSQPAPEEYGYRPPVTRAFVIGGTLWTLSDAGLLASDLATLAPGPFVALA
jgi:hypothetical protein